MRTVRINSINEEPYKWQKNKVSMVQTFAGLPRYTDDANNTYLNLSDFPKKISYKLKELETFDPQNPEHVKDADKDIDFYYGADALLYALHHQDEFLGPLLEGVNYVNVNIEITNIAGLAQLNNDLIKVSSIKSSGDLIQQAIENGYSHIFQNAEKIELSDDLSKADTLELLQKLKEYNCSPNHMTLDKRVAEQDVIMLNAIESDIQITSGGRARADSRKTKLFEEFYSQISNGSSIESGLESALQVALATDQKPYAPGHALRILQEFDWQFLGREEILQEISNLRAQYKVEPDTYHYESASDLHFYMTKVTDDNVENWDKYAAQEDDLSDNFRYNSSSCGLAKSKAGVGICAFHNSLKYYDHFETETWVAYAANKNIENPSQPTSGAIEMFVTSSTSEHAVFMTNSGIARAPSYDGNTHSQLSMKVHGFAAKIMLKMHENLAYMINSPANTMLKIAVNSFKTKFGDSSSLYLGNGNKVVNEELSVLQDSYIEMKNYMDMHKYVGVRGESSKAVYFETYKKMILREQQDLEITPPVRITANSENAAQYSSFQLFDKNQGQLCDLAPDDQHGEYAWFFDNRYASAGVQGLWGDLATFDINALSEFVEITGEVEHFQLDA